MSTPAIVLAAPASGSGKTTVATGIMGALRASGKRVAPFKVGPDYIDPGYHSLASGRVGRNLDPVLTSAALIGPLFRHGSDGADIAVIEGVMGLFDGRIGTAEPAEGSTAQVAALLGAPVILVVDVRGHSQSLAALLHGFATYDVRVRIAGVILNHVGSERHERVLRDACERAGLPVFGVIPRSDPLAVPSRHLGLVTASEHGSRAQDAVAAMSELVRTSVDLAALTRIARSSVAQLPWSPDFTLREPATPVRIALASGPAFTFTYAEQRELLAAIGAEVVEFDPRCDALPEDSAGIILPGGFPEEHAAELSANTGLAEQIRTAIARGVPVHAECAGLLYLGRSLDSHPMVGALDIAAEFGSRLVLGYRDAVALQDSAMFAAGQRVTGHEFHRTYLSESPPVGQSAWAWRDHNDVTVREGVVSGPTQGSVHASYLHTHPTAHPESIARFVAAARSGAEVRT
ncbi:cobyrinate a,c-diamide synthase [Hoyosella rhizosphaerae]|uniref:cobyrinate a,c-diamide synthase n=1 Tax=Hoyosella rhizosphaerae TaxID=1755582 RepID=UPI00355862AE